MELERELTARIIMHKIAIVKGTLAHAYISREKCKGGIMLAEPSLEQNALEFADHVMTDIMCTGKLDEAYEEAWNLLKDVMPDDYCIIGDEQDTL
jgi:hypothetical protein